MGRLGGLRGRGWAFFLRHRLSGSRSVRTLLYRCGAGTFCRFSRRRAFFRQWALTDALTARFKLVITGLNRIITVTAGAGDIVIRLFDNAPADGGKKRDDKPGQRMFGGHHGQDIQQWDDRRDELGKSGVGDIDDVGNSA